MIHFGLQSVLYAVCVNLEKVITVAFGFPINELWLN
jgi:hypothetical protein